VSNRRTVTNKEWLAEAECRFGPHPDLWRFVCPSCGHIASVGEWKDAGATEGEIAFSCIGRNLGSMKELGAKKGPCNYAGGGLFRLNPVTVVFFDGHERETFEFAEAS